jgi:hypothetical protein
MTSEIFDDPLSIGTVPGGKNGKSRHSEFVGHHKNTKEAGYMVIPADNIVKSLMKMGKSLLKC